MRRRMLWTAAALATAGLLLPLPTAAQPVADVAVRVARISSWTGPDRPLEVLLAMSNRGAASAEELSVRVVLYPRVVSRSALRASFDFGSNAEPIALTTEELEPLAPRSSRTISIVRELDALASSFAAGARPGVHPMRLEVRGATGLVAAFNTAMVFFPRPPMAPLNVVWLWTLHRAPPYGFDGTYGEEGIRALLDPDRMSRAVSMLAEQPTAITLAPSGILLDVLADLADGFTMTRGGGGGVRVPPEAPEAQAAAALLASIREAAAPGVVELASTSYARADLVRLVHNRLATDAGLQIAVGRDRVAEALGRSPTRAFFAPADHRIDARTAATLSALGVTELVLDPETLPPQASGPFQAPLFGPSRPVAVRTQSGHSFAALLIDRPVAERLDAVAEGRDRVVLAQNVLAETAAAWHELPALASERVMVLAPRGTLPPATTAALLAGLADAPWATLRTASDVLAALPPQGEPVELPLLEPELGRVVPAVIAARRVLNTLARVMPEAQEHHEPLRRLVLAAESADWTNDPDRAVALAQAAMRRARAMLGLIRAPNRQVTLTARAGEVPVTIVNRTGSPVTIRVRLRSSKLVFPRGESRVVRLRERVETMSFTAEARAAGSFPIEVLLETPDGTRRIGRGLIVVRSTAVSAVTLMATGGGSLFLLAAWARRLRRERRSG